MKNEKSKKRWVIELGQSLSVDIASNGFYPRRMPNMTIVNVGEMGIGLVPNDVNSSGISNVDIVFDTQVFAVDVDEDADKKKNPVLKLNQIVRVETEDDHAFPFKIPEMRVIELHSAGMVLAVNNPKELGIKKLILRFGPQCYSESGDGGFGLEAGAHKGIVAGIDTSKPEILRWMELRQEFDLLKPNPEIMRQLAKRMPSDILLQAYVDKKKEEIRLYEKEVGPTNNEEIIERYTAAADPYFLDGKSEGGALFKGQDGSIHFLKDLRGFSDPKTGPGIIEEALEKGTQPFDPKKTVFDDDEWRKYDKSVRPFDRVKINEQLEEIHAQELISRLRPDVISDETIAGPTDSVLEDKTTPKTEGLKHLIQEATYKNLTGQDLTKDEEIISILLKRRMLEFRMQEFRHSIDELQDEVTKLINNS